MSDTSLPTPLAIHEAGHHVVAHCLNPDVPLVTVCTPGERPFGPHSGFCFVDHTRFNDHERRMIGVAGGLALGIAGLLRGCRPKPAQVFDCVSPSDWQVMGEDPTNPSPEFILAAEAAWDVLADQWEDVLAVAEELDAKKLVLNDAAMAWLDSLPDDLPTLH